MKKKINKITDEKEFSNFSEIVGWIMKFMLSQWNIEAKPKGYDEFLKDYMDFDGMEELDEKALCKLFEGFDNAGAGHFSLPIWTSLPHTAYGDKCQGRPPLETLIGAILNYGMMIGDRSRRLKEIKKHEQVKKRLDIELKFAEDEKLKKALQYILEEINMNIEFD